jgi:hypothetical protein
LFAFYLAIAVRRERQPFTVVEEHRETVEPVIVANTLRFAGFDVDQIEVEVTARRVVQVG